MEPRRIEILGDRADRSCEKVAVILAKVLPSAVTGGITGQLMLPSRDWSLFNQIETGFRRHTNRDGTEILYKSIEVPGIPYIKLHLTALA